MANINTGGYGLGCKRLAGISGVAKGVVRGFDAPASKFLHFVCVYMHKHTQAQTYPPPPAKKKKFYTPGWNLYHIYLFWPAKDTSTCVPRGLLKTHQIKISPRH